jgi:hypothetical protein
LITTEQRPMGSPGDPITSAEATARLIASSHRFPMMSVPALTSAFSAEGFVARQAKRFTSVNRPMPSATERSTMRCNVGRDRPSRSPVPGFRPTHTIVGPTPIGHEYDHRYRRSSE